MFCPRGGIVMMFTPEKTGNCFPPVNNLSDCRMMDWKLVGN